MYYANGQLNVVESESGFINEFILPKPVIKYSGVPKNWRNPNGILLK